MRIFSYFWRLATAATVSALRVTVSPPETLVRWSLSTRAGHSTIGEVIGSAVVRPATGSASVGVVISVGEKPTGTRKLPWGSLYSPCSSEPAAARNWRRSSSRRAFGASTTFRRNSRGVLKPHRGSSRHASRATIGSPCGSAAWRGRGRL